MPHVRQSYPARDITSSKEDKGCEKEDKGCEKQTHLSCPINTYQQ